MLHRSAATPQTRDNLKQGTLLLLVYNKTTVLYASAAVCTAQYLPSALRDQGKRQLDCLGIATAVLGMCHSIAAQHGTQHADLAAARMMVSDDHCWLALPQHQQQQQQAGPVAASSSGAEDVQQLIHVEVTDPRWAHHCFLLPPEALHKKWWMNFIKC